MRSPGTILAISFVALLCGCAAAPKFDTTGVDMTVTPQRATVEAAQLGAARVLWGGMIIGSRNLKDATELEVLAYPLATNHEPDTAQSPLGRVLAVRNGYLETEDYAQGRSVTFSGALDGTRQAQIGEAEYTYPVVRIDTLHLWPQRSDASEPKVHFGIGVMFHN